MKIVRHAGTWVPLLVLGGITIAAIDQFLRGGRPTWELPIVYAFAALSFPFGIVALCLMAYYSVRRYPSFILYTFIMQKICNELLFLSATMIGYNRYISEVPTFPPTIAYPLLTASVTATAIVNFVLWWGRKRGWLEAEVDPVPFRQFVQGIRTRRRAN